jgi:hypothetical protein
MSRSFAKLLIIYNPPGMGIRYVEGQNPNIGNFIKPSQFPLRF